MSTIEYRVRPVTRYIVTRFEESEPDEDGKACASSEVIGQFDTIPQANDVAGALAKNCAESGVIFTPMSDPNADVQAVD